VATIKERLEVAYKDGVEEGMKLARHQAQVEFGSSKAAAHRDILNAAAELTQANVKLTYAMSRIVAEKGW